MKLYIYIVFTFLIFISCGKSACKYAIIGGEIINKNADYVVLLNAKKVLDTIPLDGNNRFSYKIEGLKSGFYTFKHGNEIQMVLLEPGDSIMFRLNTYDFDETLVYTGKGAKKNNYLINDFLQNEIDEKDIFKFSQYSPTDFERKIDSIRESKKRKLVSFNEKYIPSLLFTKIAQANIDYAYYTSKEIYPFAHFGNNKKAVIKSLPNNFYDYRNDINYNKDVFKDYFSYKMFLRHFFNNIALEKHLKHAKDDEFDWVDFCYNKDKLHAIDSLVTNTQIKNDLLYHYTKGFLSRNKKLHCNEDIMNLYLKYTTDEVRKDVLLSYSKAIQQLKPGITFPNTEVIDTAKNTININTLFTKPTVIYFWSHKHKRYFEESHSRINELTLKYPEVQFISVNIDNHSTKNWITAIRKKRILSNNEYILKNPKLSKKELAIFPLTKVILVRDGGLIVNGHANMFNYDFEQELLGLISQ